MNHQPHTSYLSMVLKSLPSSHLPLRTLLNAPLRWLYPLPSLHHLLNWDHLEQSRHGYALAVQLLHSALSYVYVTSVCVWWGGGGGGVCCVLAWMWVCWCVGLGVALYPVLIFHSELEMEIGTAYEAGVGMCTCGCVFVCVDKVRCQHELHSSQWSMYCFLHRLVSSFPLSLGEQVNLSFRLLPSHNQYRWDYLDLNKHRSVCIVCVYGCGCSLIPSPYFHSELGIEIGTAY